VNIDEDKIARLVKGTLVKLGQVSPTESQAGDVTAAPASGPAFATVNEAVSAAAEAQRALVQLPLETRRELIEAIRSVCTEHVDELAALAVEETGMGVAADKVQKNLLAIKKTPGVEDLSTAAFSAASPSRSWRHSGSSVRSRHRQIHPRRSSTTPLAWSPPATALY